MIDYRYILNKKFFKWCSILSTIITLSTTFYIYTYPSAYPARCSWYNAAQDGNDVDVNGLDHMSRALYYTKRYLKDVYKHNVLGVVPSKGDEDGGPQDIHMIAFGDPQIKGIWPSTDYNTRLDIYGNDHYLGHIVSVMEQRLRPSHVAVLGDLFSSQWISDSEFYNRSSRYLTRLFHRDTTWLKDLKELEHDDNGLYKIDWMTWGQSLNRKCEEEKPWNLEFGYSDVHSWDPEKEDYLFINVTGNHDIGYSGDTTYQHLARYNQVFGKDNYWIEYDRDTDHPWRIVVLNSLLLEGPALQPEFLDVTWEFLTQLAERNFEGNTILLTHVPFYKEEGLCSDGPNFEYYPEDHASEPYKSKLLRSQNHLSEKVTNEVLNLVFHNRKPGIILTGHDHEGCKTIYNKNFDDDTWTASKEAKSDLAVQEITVRAMMGEFDGNTGLLTGHFDRDQGDWEFHFKLCPFMVQHVWWVAKIFLIVTVLLWSITFFM
ncbi:hypothetical protein ZYGR_0N07010 [Zygosaccharomyces rouxii]|uniref:Calcineurin-like phosphoesterase domain-containing protein n=1 Tax=Zygosaccharomyces rouxii TaxID=4956 RepID=A0A1Q3A0S2_ZYGRO|nr:hypothetical protein ZYGR_0N07010 [Zygosaccharomyces rouxii]